MKKIASVFSERYYADVKKVKQMKNYFPTSHQHRHQQTTALIVIGNGLLLCWRLPIPHSVVRLEIRIT